MTMITGNASEKTVLNIIYLEPVQKKFSKTKKEINMCIALQLSMY